MIINLYTHLSLRRTSGREVTLYTAVHYSLIININIIIHFIIFTERPTCGGRQRLNYSGHLEICLVKLLEFSSDLLQQQLMCFAIVSVGTVWALCASHYSVSVVLQYCLECCSALLLCASRHAGVLKLGTVINATVLKRKHRNSEGQQRQHKSRNTHEKFT